jgi:macrolide transport system ATP-binding/permease protein
MTPVRAGLFVLLSRIRAMFVSRRLDEEFSDEVTAHLDMLAEDYIRSGLTPEQARRAALVRFGGPMQVQEQHRDGQRLPFVDTTLQDLRYALRACRRSPGFTALAVLTLGLGIGVNTAVFALFDAVALRGLSVRDGDHLVRLERTLLGGGRGDIQYAFSYDEYLEYRDHSRSLTGVIAASWPVRVTQGDRLLDGQIVSGNYFTELAGGARAGRLLVEDDDRTGRLVAVLSHRAWQDSFGGDLNIIGKSVRLNEAMFTIVGVAPAAFVGTGNPPRVPDFWVPLGAKVALTSGTQSRNQPQVKRLQILARLSAASSSSAARSELTVLAGRLDSESGATKTIAVTPVRATFFGGTMDPRFLAFVGSIMAVVAMVLLIACANISNMTLARAASRQREIAVRVALGAGRGRLIRQFLTESLLLGALGSAAGLLFSVWGCAWLWTNIAEAVQRYWGSTAAFTPALVPDAPLSVYALAISVLAGLAFGLSPALHATRPELTTALKDDGHGFGGRMSGATLRRLLIGGQVAVSFALLIVSGLLARGAVRSETINPGFAASDIFAVTFDHGGDPAGALDLQRRVFARLQSVDAVAGAAYVQRVPLLSTWTTAIGDAANSASTTTTLANYVSPEYFATMGVGIERGRAFSPRDGLDVAIVSDSTARRLWPAADPIGRRLRLLVSQNRAPDVREFAVVGVARDVRTANISRPDPMYVYLPTQASERYEILVRIRGPRGAAMDAVRAAVGADDRRVLPSLHLLSLEQLAHDQQLVTSILARFMSVLAILALALAAIGIYTVMNFIVARRVHEIGIRMALGASRSSVVGLVLGDGLRPVGWGGLIGLACALALSSAARAILVAPESPDLLFGIGAFDVATFIVVCSVLTLVALAASALPVYRAARVDPLTAVRSE